MQKNIGIVAALILGLVLGYVFGSGAGRVQPHMMQGMMDDMNAQLVLKTGDAFDRTFITEMIIHHEGAVSMAELALKNAQRQEIKDLAQAIIAAQNKEIEDMKRWHTEWFGK